MEKTKKNIEASISPERLKEDFENNATRFHIVGVWVAIIFDPIFGITDYLNIPGEWKTVFIIRIAVSLLCLLTLFAFKKRMISTYLLVFIPFILISFQNAYTYSLVNETGLVGHNLNYLALFLGTSLFALWPLAYSLIAFAFSAGATLYFVQVNEVVQLDDFAVNGGLLLTTGALFTIFMIQARYALRKKEVKSRLTLNETLKISMKQKAEIEKNHNLVEIQARELKEAKEKIERMNEVLTLNNQDLEDKVDLRTRKLEKSQKEMNKLVYSLAHDFRTPMVNVKGLLDLANEEKDPVLLHDFLEKISSTMDGFDSLLSDLRNYSVYWEEEIKNEKFLLSHLVGNTWNQIHHKRNCHSKIPVIYFEGRDYLVSDRNKLNVVLYCLFLNSLNYSREGVVTEITITYQVEGNLQKLEITDNGSGISSAVLPRVYNMFYRGDVRSKGAGIGLYFARGIMEQLGGSILIRSKEGEGTTVFLEIPEKVRDEKKVVREKFHSS